MPEPVGYLLGVGIRPLAIYPGTVMTIGRDAQNVVPLADVLTSRHHAVLECDSAGQVSLRDLDSANGTFVNNEMLPPQENKILGSGDYVRIGGKLLSLVANTSTAEPKNFGQRLSNMETLRDGLVFKDGKLTPRADRKQKNVERTQRVMPLEKERADSALSGKLSDQNLAQIIQFLTSNNKTGELHVQGKNRDGVIAFNNGQIFFSEAGDRKGVIAVYACARERDGVFHFVSMETPPDKAKNVNEPVMQIIFECCRRIDETELSGQ